MKIAVFNTEAVSQDVGTLGRWSKYAVVSGLVSRAHGNVNLRKCCGNGWQDLNRRFPVSGTQRATERDSIIVVTCGLFASGRGTEPMDKLREALDKLREAIRRCAGNLCWADAKRLGEARLAVEAALRQQTPAVGEAAVERLIEAGRLISLLSYESGEPADGFRFRQGVAEIRAALTALGRAPYQKSQPDTPPTPPSDESCSACGGSRVIESKPSGAGHSDDLAEYLPCPDCASPPTLREGLRDMAIQWLRDQAETQCFTNDFRPSHVDSLVELLGRAAGQTSGDAQNGALALVELAYAKLKAHVDEEYWQEQKGYVELGGLREILTALDSARAAFGQPSTAREESKHGS